MTLSKKQPINGVFLLNKPLGMSSNRALQMVKRAFNAEKAGHTGSLDPEASGMLPICLGHATKFSQYLLDADKVYETTARLGVTTTTGDSEGEITQQLDEVSVSQAELLDVIQSFVGESLQVPSMYSALKLNGQPLYRLARQGIEVERAPRKISISSLELLDFDGLSFTLRVACSKGTYIRNLVEDIGTRLGVGAHVQRLHRVHTAGLGHLPMHTLETLDALEASARLALLQPVDLPVLSLPACTIEDDDYRMLTLGQNIELSGEACEKIRLYLNDGRFVGLGRITSGRLYTVRLILI